ncbi:hypothetical protein O0I10_004899 [Lichtheimia ornata]|uniref:Uncharacterized protein n=1 Tax=Lichtheimia ornata TaxID=688661 RepID=A0AAD7V5Y0_9FUNG|nr:uncharacterized protein O0I10_004899 [Lichtheimia ornata]KAJ8659534.1 hypothetical protein O0I10_004899 [Lichtheimia ornata]
MSPLFILLVADDKDNQRWHKSSLHFIGGGADADDKTINVGTSPLFIVLVVEPMWMTRLSIWHGHFLLSLFMNQSILGCNSHEHNLAAIGLTKEYHAKQSHECNERHNFGRGIVIGGALYWKQSSQASSNYHSYQATSDMGRRHHVKNTILSYNKTKSKMQYHKKSTSAKIYQKKAAATSYEQQRSSIFLRQSKFNHAKKGSLNGADHNIIVM